MHSLKKKKISPILMSSHRLFAIFVLLTTLEFARAITDTGVTSSFKAVDNYKQYLKGLQNLAVQKQGG